MRFLCDEGVERQIPAELRACGHTVWYVAEMDPGLPDAQVLSLCRLHEATLITADKDFGEIRTATRWSTGYRQPHRQGRPLHHS